MESENFEDISRTFNQIDIQDEPGSEKYSTHFRNPNKPQPTLRYIPAKYVDFEQYVKENCHNRIKIMHRKTFNQINRPILIFFNHFRDKCAYHTKWLDELYKLALKYGDRMEFVAADMIDMDIMYSGRNPIQFFCNMVAPECETPNTYAIDEKKRIYTHYNSYRTIDSLCELCESLLNGTLFPSLAIPENNETKLVKICVYLNYEELIIKSTKNILLIANMDRYQHSENEPNYENVAVALKDCNLDIIYMDVEKNYIPFEYHVNCYPTILFIPSNDKNNFIYFEGPRKEAAIIEFLKKVINEPQFLMQKQNELKSRTLRKTVQVANDFNIDFNDLSQFLQENFDNRFKVLDRQILKKRHYCTIIIFMDFPNMKCLSNHVEWLEQIYQVAERSYSQQFLIADFKDIDIINTKWQPSDLVNSAQEKPRIYAFDYLKHTYEFGNFDSIPALFYFISDLQNRHFYYSQVYPGNNIHEKIKDWTADYFNIFLKKTKQHIFITFYSSDDDNAHKLQCLLNEIVDDVDGLNVEVAKFDIKFNYVDLEYANDKYPLHYFIHKNNKSDSRLYIDRDLNRQKILEFIKTNLAMN